MNTIITESKLNIGNPYFKYETELAHLSYYADDDEFSDISVKDNTNIYDNYLYKSKMIRLLDDREYSV